MISYKIKGMLTDDEWKELVQEIRYKTVKREINYKQLDRIASLWSEYYGMHPDELKYRGLGARERERLHPCLVFMWYCAGNTNYSLKQIGKYCGGRDHSTVINARRRINDAIDIRYDYGLDALEFEKKINSLL